MNFVLVEPGQINFFKSLRKGKLGQFVPNLCYYIKKKSLYSQLCKGKYVLSYEMGKKDIFTNLMV